MKDLWKIIEKVDDGAEIISEAATTISKASKSILISTGVLTFASIISISVYTFWEGRTELGKTLFNLIVSGVSNAPTLSYPWERVPVETWPEGWICNERTLSCKPDTVKRDAVINILKEVKSQTGGIRAVYSVYGDQYRRIAAQVNGPGQKSLEEDLWVIRTTDFGYSENITQHFRGFCNDIIISKLPDNSRLRVEAPLYNTAQITNCPTNENDVAYLAKGYISVDFSREIKSVEQLENIKDSIKAAAEKVEDVMGY